MCFYFLWCLFSLKFVELMWRLNKISCLNLSNCLWWCWRGFCFVLYYFHYKSQLLPLWKKVYFYDAFSGFSSHKLICVTSGLWYLIEWNKTYQMQLCEINRNPVHRNDDIYCLLITRINEVISFQRRKFTEPQEQLQKLIQDFEHIVSLSGFS